MWNEPPSHVEVFVAVVLMTLTALVVLAEWML